MVMCCSQTFQERLGLGSTKDVQVNREIVTNVSTALSKLGSKVLGPCEELDLPFYVVRLVQAPFYITADGHQSPWPRSRP